MPGLRVIQRNKSKDNKELGHRTAENSSNVRHKPGAKTSGNSRDNSGSLGQRQRSMPGRTKAQAIASRMNATET